MKPAPHLLDELVKLTSIRDAELLEYSLLRTIQDILSPRVLSLFRLGANGEPCYQMICDAERGPRVVAVDAPLSAQVLAVARALPEGCDVQREMLADGATLAVYPVIESRGSRTFLQVVTDDGAGGDDDRLIFGFLRFYENYCGLLDYSQRDQLTGLMNRKTFDESVYKLFSQSERGELPAAQGESDDRRSRSHAGQFWLGMIDIDHFKRINDSFGHLYGDEVLLLAAQIMQRGFRDSDLLFRFGGEEFVVITQHTDLQGAKTVFGRLLESIAGFSFPQIGRVTVSIGIVELVPGHLTPILLDQADKALYYAKQNGRNQVAVYEELRQRGLLGESKLAVGSVDLF